MTTGIVSGQEARKKLLEGIMDVSKPVASTLGPWGKTVVISTLEMGYYRPYVTKDGVTVAKSITPNDPIKSAGALMVKQAAIATGITAGDGTTSSTVLASYLCEKGAELVENGQNPHIIKKQMEAAAERVCEYLRSKAIKCDTIDKVRQVATISANGDSSIGEIVAEAYAYIGEGGAVVISKSTTNKTRVETVEGMQVDGGTSIYFINDDRNQRCTLKGAAIFVTEEIVTTLAQIQNCTEFWVKQGTPVVLIAEQITGEAANFLMANGKKYNLCGIMLKDFGDRKQAIMHDIAAVTGAAVHGSSRPIQKSTGGTAGKCEQIDAYLDKVIITGGKGQGDAVAARLTAITSEMEGLEDKSWHERRIANMTGGLSCIYVGANTEIEIGELMDRYDDAVKAVRSARESGVLPGGGKAFISAIDREGDIENPGSELLYAAIMRPFLQICENKGELVSVEDVLGKGDNYGYNAATGEFGDLVEMGVIDPAIVPITALENAVSVAGAVITSSYVVSNVQ